jgi:hypothetical protein
MRDKRHEENSNINKHQMFSKDLVLLVKDELTSGAR